MEHTIFCQSCTMPMENNGDHGTEKDGSKSDLYCKYCYGNGQFTKPDITLDQMKTHIESKMNKLGLAKNIIQLSLSSLPHLKRWKKESNPAEFTGK